MRFKEIKDLLIKEGRWDERTGEYYPSPKEQADLDAWEETFQNETVSVEVAFEETIFEYLLHPVLKNSAQKIIQQYGIQDAMNKYTQLRDERLERDTVPTNQDVEISTKIIELIENNQPVDRQLLMTHLATMLAEINKYATDIETFRKNYH